MNKTGINLSKPVIKVRHEDLERFSDESLFKSKCPTCKEGVLLVSRHPKTFVLISEDFCILCGQHYFYTDLKDGEFKYFEKRRKQ